MGKQLVGASIRTVREFRGLSLRALAGMVGVSPATMSAIEHDRTPITLDRLQSVAEALDVPVAPLVDGSVVVDDPRLGPPDATDGDWRSYGDLELHPVLQAAARLFVRQGFHATTMREVAAEAGLSVAGVYHHHPSKQSILVALLDVAMREVRWRMEAARLEGASPVDSFALMVESLALFHVERADLAFIGASEMRALHADERMRITSLRDDVQHALDRQAAMCAEAGDFPAGDLATACRAVATMCTSLPSWFRDGGRLTAKEVALRYSAYAVALLRAHGTEPSNLGR